MLKKKLRKITPREVAELSEEIDMMTDKVSLKIKKEIRSAFNDDEIMNCLVSNQSDHLTRFNRKTYKLFEDKIDLIIKKFDSIQKLHEITEETLRNVLIAIKQNEYLQAWYPAQNGYPEMKVTGIHPLKKDREDKHNAFKNNWDSDTTEEA